MKSFHRVRRSARILTVATAMLTGGFGAALEGACGRPEVEVPPPSDLAGDAAPPSDAAARDSGRDSAASTDDAGGADADAGTSDGDTGDAACTGADLTARWSAMLASPIAPPNHYASLDLAGPTGTGLGLAAAEAVNCAGTITTANDAGKWPSMSWGSSGQVTLNYDQSTLLAGTVILDAAPPFTFKSRDGAHSYVLAIGQSVTKDGAPFTIDWTSQTTINQDATELDDAIRATYAPALPVNTDCGGTTGSVANCQAYLDDFDGHSYIGFTGPDATGSSRIALWVYFARATSVTNFFLGAAVLNETDGGVDGGDGG